MFLIYAKVNFIYLDKNMFSYDFGHENNRKTRILIFNHGHLVTIFIGTSKQQRNFFVFSQHKIWGIYVIFSYRDK